MMPINPSTGLYEPPWQFSDEFAVSDPVRRSDFDLLFADITTAINEALAVVAVATAAASQAQAYAAGAATAGAIAGSSAGAAAAEAAAAERVAEAQAFAEDAEAAKDAAQVILDEINPDGFAAIQTTVFTGDLNTVSPPQIATFLTLGSGVTNAPSGAGEGDFLLHLQASSSQAVQTIWNAEQTAMVGHRAKIAGVWGAWNSVAPIAGDVTFTGGHKFTSVDDGAYGSGAYTPSPVGGNLRRVTNSGAFTIMAPSAAGDFSLTVLLTNSGAAGAVTFSGFTRVTGSSLTATAAHAFLLFITKINGQTLVRVEALQ
jgi:hypothetical protein